MAVSGQNFTIFNDSSCRDFVSRYDVVRRLTVFLLINAAGAYLISQFQDVTLIEGRRSQAYFNFLSLNHNK